MFVADRRRGLRIGLVAGGMAASLTLLAACSSDGGSAPRTLPPLSTTPAAVTSTAPPTTKAADLAAATAVVRRYFTLKNGLRQNMNAVALDRLETSDCPCRRFLNSVRQIAAKHERYFGRAVSLHLTPAADSDALVEVLASYDTTAGGIADAKGHILTQGKAHRGVVAMFYVKRVRDRWLISDIVNLKPGTTS